MLYHTLTRTSPFLGGWTSISSIERGLQASHATAARHLITYCYKSTTMAQLGQLLDAVCKLIIMEQFHMCNCYYLVSLPFLALPEIQSNQGQPQGQSQTRIYKYPHYPDPINCVGVARSWTCN